MRSLSKKTINFERDRQWYYKGFSWTTADHRRCCRAYGLFGAFWQQLKGISSQVFAIGDKYSSLKKPSFPTVLVQALHLSFLQQALFWGELELDVICNQRSITHSFPQTLKLAVEFISVLNCLL